MNKKLVIAILIIGMLALSAGVIYAQGGNGNGRGNGDNDNTTCQNDCTGDAQQQQNGNRNANQQNGNMNNNQQNGNRNANQQNGNRNANQQNGNGSAYQYQNSGWLTMLPAKSDLPLTDAVIQAMVDGYTDEFNAHSAYVAIVEQFGELRPVYPIMFAEAQHMDAWLFLFERYGVDVPELQTPELPTFATYRDAVAFARDAEIANAGLYDQMLASLADYPDMVQVVTNLRDASLNNHLRAFENYLQ